MDQNPLRPESIVVAGGRPERGPEAPITTPIMLTAPYHHGPDDNHYSRQRTTDTVRSFEAAMGELEGGHAIAFASGMAAIAAVAESRPLGITAVVPDAGYSGTTTIFGQLDQGDRLTAIPVDIADTDAVLAALPGASLLWLETVTNPLLTVPDLPVLIEAGHAAGALVCVDATFSTPLLYRALDAGVDVVAHSVTKFLSGHSDLLMGVLVTRDEQLAEALRTRRTMTGAIPGALECYLALRGLRTLAVRLERAQDNAQELAVRLADHPRVSRVRYPGLPDDPGHQRAAAQFAGFGAMISFEVAGGADGAEQLCRSVRLITHATSLGGVESLIERRARHAIDEASGTPPNLLRLSVGIEHVDDLWSDLAQALG